MKEIWEDIVDWENLYQASSLGRIKSLDRITAGRNGILYRIKGRILRSALDRYGYPQVVLFHSDRRKTKKIHRLVASAFIPNPNNLPQINHKDGNKQNNLPVNLEWCTGKENVNHAYHVLGRKGISYNKGKFGELHHLSKKVVQIDIATNAIIKEFHGLAEAARQTGFQRSKIGSVCNNKRNHTGGYKWRFI